jgi:hypothetical protein
MLTIPNTHFNPPLSVEKPDQHLQFIVRLNHSRTHVIDCHFDVAHRPDCDGNDNNHDNYSTDGTEMQQYIIEQLAIKAQLPKRMLYLHNFRQLQETLNVLKTCDTPTTNTFFLSAFTHLPIRGGKGGFGTLLKGQSKQAGARQTTDFGACRDLNGRRLRHINDEIKLQKWRESIQRRAARLGDDKSSFSVQEELQALKTSSGIRNWHLMVPNWGSGEMSQKHRRKEEIRLEREIQRWAQEENEKISQKMRKKRELEQLKMDYAMAGMQHKGQMDVDEVLSHSVLEGMKKRKLRDTNETRDTHSQQDESSSGRSHVLEDQGLDTVTSLGALLGTTSQFLCTLSGDIVVQQEENDVLNSVSSQRPDVEVEQSETKLQSIMIQSKSEFATAVVLLPRNDHHNQWTIPKEAYCQALSLYYEVTIETGGIAQIGWACLATSKQEHQGFSPNSDTGDGVGDDFFSFGFDGLRGKIFHDGHETDYGPQTATPWKKGDVVGCLYDKSNRTISFSVNGNDYGKAFDVEEEFTDQWLCPAISINEKEVIIVNIGPYFRHGPKDRPLAVSFLLNNDSTNVESTVEDKDDKVKVTHDEKTATSLEYVDLAGIPIPSKHDSGIHNSDNVLKKSRLNICSSKDVDQHETADTSEDFNLDNFNSPNELESLGMETLKKELFKLGCKCGGSLEERAKRLFCLKGLQRDQIPFKLRGKNFDQVQL